MRGIRAATLALAASALLLTGCGEETASPNATPDDGVTSIEPSEATETPELVTACDEVWQVGARLPADYAGCALTAIAGEIDDTEGIYCESGQVIFTHEQFYAAAGRKVMKADGPLKKDAHFQHALKACRG
jgi:hypothetical protein